MARPLQPRRLRVLARRYRGCLAQGRRPSIWISYAPLDDLTAGAQLVFDQHRLLAVPAQVWETLKVGAGTPPIRIGNHWLLLFHCVSGCIADGVDQQQGVRYCAGAVLLDGRDPRHVLYRTSSPILEPCTEAERLGVVPQVVSPTGVDLRRDGTLDVYYGMADSRIGVARATVSGLLAEALATPARKEFCAPGGVGNSWAAGSGQVCLGRIPRREN